MREQRFIEPLEILAEMFDVLGSVFIYSNLICLLVGEDKVFEKLILEVRRGGEVLAIRSDLWFQAYKIKVEFSAIDDALQNVGKVGLATTSKEDGQGIFLFDAELHELDLHPVSAGVVLLQCFAHDGLIPPAFPSLCFLLIHSVASSTEDARIMPPSTVCKAVYCLKVANGRPSPELWVWKRAREDCLQDIRHAVKDFWWVTLTGIVKIVDMELLDIRHSYSNFSGAFRMLLISQYLVCFHFCKTISSSSRWSMRIAVEEGPCCRSEGGA